MQPNSNPRLFSFIGGNEGPWTLAKSRAVTGEALPAVARLNLVEGEGGVQTRSQAAWILQGVTSNARYVTRPEKLDLQAKQQPLGRSEVEFGVLIPIRKNAAWWELTQDERRKIFEEQSQHTQVGLEYLPAISRQLHHCRDLARSEPFDFLTWFEFARPHASAFDHLLERLRSSLEWTYVEREVELWFEREPR